MNIAILSRGPHLYSTQSLYNAGIKRGHNMFIIDHMRCNLIIEKNLAAVYYEGQSLDYLDAIIPRIGASVTGRGAAVIRHFESMKVCTTARSAALLQARDKLQCLQKLARFGVDTPKTIFTGYGQEIDEMIEELGGLPIVIKLLESTQGIGVILAESLRSAESTLEAFQKLKEKVILQEFIKEAGGADYRAFLVDGEIVATMKRQAKQGEFRSNLHRGGDASTTVLTAHEQYLVKKATRIMGLDVAGVDLIRSERGPLIMEVNASPGLEGIEGITGINIAGSIINFVEKQIQKTAIDPKKVNPR